MLNLVVQNDFNAPEGSELRFRAEFYNLTNAPQFSLLVVDARPRQAARIAVAGSALGLQHPQRVLRSAGGGLVQRWVRWLGGTKRSEHK